MGPSIGGLEHVLGVARRDDDHAANRIFAGVSHRVTGPARHEHRAACRDRKLATTQEEAGLAGRNVERLVRMRMQVRRRPGLTGREGPHQGV